ncbi:MAG: T9SS type A sorting domain-containing protein [Ignavibacteriaceae bacterium]
MKLILSLLLIFSSIYSLSFGQNQQPVIESYLILTDGVTVDTLYFGIDPAASDTLDYDLGEANLPPLPPQGAFDVRFVLPLNNFSGEKSSWRDYRNGNSPYTGQVEHRVKFQRGSGDSMTVIYSLPQEVNCTLQDLFGGVIFTTQFIGSGQFTIPNPDALQQAKLLVNYTNATDVEEDNLVADNFSLSQNYPNPFNPATSIQYSIAKNEFVSLKVYDVLGREVTTLINEEVSAGNYNVSFNASGLTSGIYFYTLSAGKISQTKSMILLK